MFVFHPCESINTLGPRYGSFRYWVCTEGVRDAIHFSFTASAPSAHLSSHTASVPCMLSHPQLSALRGTPLDRKSTRLNSSHSQISYAVFCLKKKNTKKNKT